jgi:hypothetical protein
VVAAAMVGPTAIVATIAARPLITVPFSGVLARRVVAP